MKAYKPIYKHSVAIIVFLKIESERKLCVKIDIKRDSYCCIRHSFIQLFTTFLYVPAFLHVLEFKVNDSCDYKQDKVDI